MQRFSTKLATGVATAALVAQAFVPMAFAANLSELSGNGAYSDNEVDIEQTHTTSVVQSNEATVVNRIDANSSTGENDTSFNTGGDSVIMTGDTKTLIDVRNQLNANYAAVQPGMTGGSFGSLIEGNGAGSDNEVEVENSHAWTLFQNNGANVVNDVDAKAETGENDAEYNTGGDSMVKTGKTQTAVGVQTTANGNWAWVGNDMPTLSLLGGDADAIISGNGAYSDNEIDYELSHSSLLTQENGAHIRNWIDADSYTGENDAKYNTGGDAVIQTGATDTFIGIDTSANFNMASLGSDAFGSAFGSLVEGNGAYSDSNVWVDDVHKEDLFQTNGLNLKNDADAKSETGENDAKSNTGDSNDDFGVMTGGSTTQMLVKTQSNVNMSADSWTVGGTTIDFDFDFGDMFGFLW